jgi:hypothetical protein
LRDARAAIFSASIVGIKLRTHRTLLVVTTVLPLLVLAVSVVILVQRERQVARERALQETARALAAASIANSTLR